MPVFPVSPSVQEAEAVAAQPPSTKGLALGDKDKQTNSREECGRRLNSQVTRPLGQEMLKGLG